MTALTGSSVSVPKLPDARVVVNARMPNAASPGRPPTPRMMLIARDVLRLVPRRAPSARSRSSIRS